ncbi:hypothetical protein AVEN_196453-1 [Araneus ventricosus]|uniref:Uncharacterized protein n=1 Tax=Araneus ventricosus TaxID=182803 RepID=A0A4Y2AUB0_ARAVE|nr:hypothetical protein AVEN_196453-1 [Araneus ventricosus]
MSIWQKARKTSPAKCLIRCSSEPQIQNVVGPLTQRSSCRINSAHDRVLSSEEERKIFNSRFFSLGLISHALIDASSFVSSPSVANRLDLSDFHFNRLMW